MKKKCLTLLTVAAALSVSSTVFADMADSNSVNSAAIINGQVATVDLADSAVTTAKIAAGAVTDAKISGTISTSKLNVGTASGTVAAGNHNHDGIYQQKYGNVIVVAKSGGDYADPVQALYSIGDASATNPYLVKIMPGVYDIGTNEIHMKPFVNIEGSGQETTQIIGASHVLLWGSDNAELSNLTLADTNGFYALVNSSASPKISHVTAISTSSMSYTVANENSSATFADVTVVSHGVSPTSTIMGILNSGGAPTFTNLKVDVSDTDYPYGIVNSHSAPTFHNLTVTVTGPSGYAIWNGVDLNQSVVIDGATINGDAYGIYNGLGTVEINNSRISAPSAVTSHYGTGRNEKTFIANTMVDGTIGIEGSGDAIFKCVAVYNANYDTVTCP